MSIPPSDPAFSALLASLAVDETVGGAGAARSEGGVLGVRYMLLSPGPLIQMPDRLSKVRTIPRSRERRIR